ncbi:MAG: alkaline phosphatase D family protein [Pseudomonadota bacterium]
MGITRRDLLTSALMGAAVSPGCSLVSTGNVRPNPVFPSGVASGDPTAHSVVLWTHVDLAALERRSVAVAWCLVRESDGALVQSGNAMASDEHDGCVHIDVNDLDARTRYRYWFELNGRRSRIGRTKTLPAKGDPVAEFHFALASCQNFAVGEFAAYGQIASDDLDLVIHCGDYIYETPGAKVRDVPVPEAVTLADYRTLYRLYRTDQYLQEAHAAHPWMLIWDDHEVVNDWGRDHYLPSRYNAPQPIETFPERKAAAQQAFVEYMPLSAEKRRRIAEHGVHDHRVIGDLLELAFVDSRQFRDPPACEMDANNHFVPCEAVLDPRRTMLGHQQERWITDTLGRGDCRWTGVIQPTLFAPNSMRPDELRYEADAWDNYPAARDRLLGTLSEASRGNALSFGGNIHAFFAGVVKPPNSIGEITEFVTTSINAPGGGQERYDAFQADDRRWNEARFFDNRVRGFTRITVEGTSVHGDLLTDSPRGGQKVLARVTRPSGSPLRVKKMY